MTVSAIAFRAGRFILVVAAIGAIALTQVVQLKGTAGLSNAVARASTFVEPYLTRAMAFVRTDDGALAGKADGPPGTARERLLPIGAAAAATASPSDDARFGGPGLPVGEPDGVLVPVLARSGSAGGPGDAAAPSVCTADAGELDALVTGDLLRLRFFERGALAGEDEGDRAGRVVSFERLDLSGTYEIGPDGSLSLPVIGRVRAAGLSPACLERVVAGAMLEAANLIVQASANFVSRPPITVAGLVRAPGSYTHGPGLTVARLLVMAGAQTGAGTLDGSRRVQLEARREEIRRLLAGNAIERHRIEAEESGLARMTLKASERLLFARRLDPDRLPKEEAKLRAAHETREATDKARAQALSSYDSRIERAEATLAILEGHTRTLHASLDQLVKLYRNSRLRLPSDKERQTIVSVMTAERAELAARNTLVDLRAERENFLRDAAMADAKRREEIADLARTLAERNDALIGQMNAVETELALAASVRDDAPGMHVMLERHGPAGPTRMAVEPEFRLRPGDYLEIDRPAEVRVLQAGAGGVEDGAEAKRAKALAKAELLPPKGN